MDDIQSLIEELRTDIREVEDDSVKTLSLMWRSADALEAAEKRIAELEAQLPKEGEWIEVNKIKTYCSNCNWASYSMLVQKDAFILRNNKTKFCPNCGAKMDGETEHGNTYSLGKIEMPKGAIEQIIADGERKEGAE